MTGLMAEGTRSGFWESLEARYQPFQGPNPVGAHVATRIGIYAALGAALNIATIAAFAALFDELTFATISILFAVVYVAATVYFVFTGDVQTQTVVILASSVLGNIAGHIVLGGYLGSGGFIFFGVLVSAVSALLLGRRWTILITSAYVLAAAVLAVLEPIVSSWRTPPDPIVSTVIAVDVFVVTLLILAPMAYLLTRALAEEQGRSESLLLNVFPASIAERLKAEPDVIAEEFQSCTVLFADLVGFTRHAGLVEPERLVDELNLVFSRFDDLVARRGAEKIKTIGDGYLAVAGVPNPLPDHLAVVCDLALDMQAEMAPINDALGSTFDLRIGVHTGRAVAGVIGNSRFSYDIWGDTVNIASRLQTEGAPGSVVVSAEVADGVGSDFRVEELGLLELKGKGPTPAYLLSART